LPAPEAEAFESDDEPVDVDADVDAAADASELAGDAAVEVDDGEAASVLFLESRLSVR
jgi:hypothetical protein